MGVAFKFFARVPRATARKPPQKILATPLPSPVADPGGAQGASAPPSTVNFPSSITDLLVLEFYTMFNIFFHKNIATKLCSEVRNFVEKKHFAARNQLQTLNRLRHIRRHGLLIWGRGQKFCARLTRAHLCAPPSSTPGSAPVAYSAPHPHHFPMLQRSN